MLFGVVIFPFWHLVTVYVDLRITVTWGESEAWKRQTQIWWLNTPRNNKEGGADK